MSAPAIDARSVLAARLPDIEQALARAVARWRGSLPDEVGAALAHGVLSGGKRLRPVLCLEAYAAAGGTSSDATARADLAASLELIHAYSLMHDDLPSMDNADLRRGEPTTHRVHGERATMIAGIALIPVAVRQALEAARALGCDEPRARQVARELAVASGAAGMVGGQGLDLLGEGRALGEAELTELHRHKTGALLTAALVMGAIAAGAAPGQVAAFEQYGRHIGLAFQIADDVLDATATAEALGKEPSDAELGKSTYVSLHGVDEARRLGEAEVAAGLAALAGAGIVSAPLEAIARYIVERKN